MEPWYTYKFTNTSYLEIFSERSFRQKPFLYISVAKRQMCLYLLYLFTPLFIYTEIAVHKYELHLQSSSVYSGDTHKKNNRKMILQMIFSLLVFLVGIFYWRWSSSNFIRLINALPGSTFWSSIIEGIFLNEDG